MDAVFHLLNRRNIFVNLTVGTKKELLELLLTSFKEETTRAEYQAIKEAVYQREEMMSTGIGNGVAIPHGESSEINHQHLALAVLETPVDYESFDDQPVSVVFYMQGQNRKGLLTKI